MGNRLLIIVFIVIATLGYAAYQALVLEDKLASQITIKADSVVSVLPEVSFQKFDESGRFEVSKEANGKNLVVHFWATWCGPCEAEFPRFEKLLLENDLTNTVFLFVAVNDAKQDIIKFINRFPKLMKKVVLLEDNDNTYQEYFGTYKLPETYIFGKDQKLIRKLSGPQDWDKPIFTSFFKDL